jgi:valyl-tRNA synthetase
MLTPVGEVLAAIRRTKTEAKVSQKAIVSQLVVSAPAATQALVKAAESDLRDAGSIAEVQYAAAETLSCTVELAPVTETA